MIFLHRILPERFMLLRLPFSQREFCCFAGNSGKIISRPIGVGLVFVLILLTGAGSLAQGGTLLGDIKGSVVNRQYEKGKDVFTVEKIQLNQGNLVSAGTGRRFSGGSFKGWIRSYGGGFSLYR